MQAELTSAVADATSEPTQPSDSLAFSAQRVAGASPVDLSTEQFSSVSPPSATLAEMKTILLAALTRVLEDEVLAERSALQAHEAKLNEETDEMLADPRVPLERITLRALELGIPETVIREELAIFTSQKDIALTLEEKMSQEATALGLPANSSLEDITSERKRAAIIAPFEQKIKFAVVKLLEPNVPLEVFSREDGSVRDPEHEDEVLRIEDFYFYFAECRESRKELKPAAWLHKLFGQSEYRDVEHELTSFKVTQETQSPSVNRLLKTCKQYGIEISYYSPRGFLSFKWPQKTETPN